MNIPAENYVSAPGAVVAKVRRALGRQDVHVFMERRMKWFFVFWRGDLVDTNGLSPGVRSDELTRLRRVMETRLSGKDKGKAVQVELDRDKSPQILREKIDTYYDGEAHRREAKVKQWSTSKSEVVP